MAYLNLSSELKGKQLINDPVALHLRMFSARKPEVKLKLRGNRGFNGPLIVFLEGQINGQIQTTCTFKIVSVGFHTKTTCPSHSDDLSVSNVKTAIVTIIAV